MADETEFLSRWSKRKAESRESPKDEASNDDASKDETSELDAEANADAQPVSLETEDGELVDPDDHPAPVSTSKVWISIPTIRSSCMKKCPKPCENAPCANCG